MPQEDDFLRVLALPTAECHCGAKVTVDPSAAVPVEGKCEHYLGTERIANDIYVKFKKQFSTST